MSARRDRHSPPSDPVIPSSPSRLDLHTHTLRSDGVLEPRDLVEQAAAAGVRLLAITDHDDMAAFRELTAAGAPPLPVGPGAAAGRRDQLPDERAARVLGRRAAHPGLRRAARRRRLRGDPDPPAPRPPDSLRSDARDPARGRACPVDAAAARLDLGATEALGRPTVARLLIASGHASSVEEAFSRWLGRGCPAYVPREGIGPVAAIGAIRAAGGLPVLAHFGEAEAHSRAPARPPGDRPWRSRGLLPHVRPRARRLGRPGRRRARPGQDRRAATSMATPARTPRSTPRRGFPRPSAIGCSTRWPSDPGSRWPPMTELRGGTRALPMLEVVAAGRSRSSAPLAADDRVGEYRPGCAGPASLRDLDARLPDEPERLGGDGRPAARRRLRRGERIRDGRPDRDQHLRDPRGRRAEGDRPPGPAGQAQGGEPRPAGRPDRLLGARARPGRTAPALPRGRPVPAPGRGAGARRPARPGVGPGRLGLARAGPATGATTQVGRTVVGAADHLAASRAAALDGGAVRRESATSAWLPIVYGCDKTCTYCIVPFSRGPERSRPFDEILDEARGLAAARLPRGDPARPERQQLRPRPAARGTLRGDRPGALGRPPPGPPRPARPRRPAARRSTGSGRPMAGRPSRACAS